MNHAEMQRNSKETLRTMIEQKRLIDNRHFDQIAVGNDSIAWILFDAEAFRNKDSQEAWIDLQVRVKTYGKWSANIPVRLDFGTQTEVLFSFSMPRPLNITCNVDAGDFYKISISSSTYDRLNAINNWDLTKTSATKCA
jgi:hypothetical protein